MSKEATKPKSKIGEKIIVKEKIESGTVKKILKKEF
jgi:hypothetical protein